MNYMDIWAPKTGEKKQTNEYDKFEAAIYHDKRDVAHAPKNLSKQWILYGLVLYGSVCIWLRNPCQI